MANPLQLIDPHTLHTQIDDPAWVILDVGRAAVYAQVHLPRARWVDRTQLMSGHPDALGSLPDLVQLQGLIHQLGIHPDQQIIVYDDEGGGWAGRLLWTLEVLGFQQLSLLDGGLHTWLAQGLPTQSGEPVLPSFTSSAPALTIYSDARIERAEILTVLTQSINQQPIFWDCRSFEEYCGEQLTARRGGHLPHARHYEWTTLMDRERHLRLRPLDLIRQELTERGIIQHDRPIVTYCQSHHRSGLSYVVGRLLGLSIRAYDGGWSEWGNRSDTPIHIGELP
jgi:thiosulfate/3-mercaptopyruvate sulfurtransferase